MAPKKKPNLAQRARAKTKLSQRAFAEMLGVSFVTVARWESPTDPQEPSGTAQALLRVIEAHPKIVVRVLES